MNQWLYFGYKQCTRRETLAKIGYVFLLTLALAATTLDPLWKSTTSMPLELASHVVLTQGHDYLYFIGGKDSNGNPVTNVSSAQIMPNYQLGNWKSISSLPYPLYLHAAAIDDNYLYVIGGWDGKNWRSETLSALIKNNGEIEPWQETMAYCNGQKVTLHAAVIAKGYLYVLGGEDEQKRKLKKVCRAVLDAGVVTTWQELPQRLREPLFRSAVVAYQDHIYVVGGNNGERTQNKVYVTNVDADGNLSDWALADYPLPEPREYHTALIVDNKLTVLGGRNGTTEFNSIYTAIIKANGALEAWTSEPGLTESRYRFGAAAVNLHGSNGLYVLGGLHNNVYRNNVDYAIIPPSGSLSLQLKTQPLYTIADNGMVTYTIEYQNGASDLHEAMITNTLPTDVMLIPTSLTDDGGKVTFTTDNNLLITWTFNNKIAAYQQGAVTYSVEINNATAIVNENTYIKWNFIGKDGQAVEQVLRSNLTINGPYQLYLPLVNR